MHVPHTMTEIAQTLRHAFQPLITAEHRAAERIGSIFHTAREYERDIQTAIENPAVLDECDRRTDELKVVVGSVCAIGGAFEGPLAFIGGAAAVAEGLYHLESAGHKYRMAHPAPDSPSP